MAPVKNKDDLKAAVFQRLHPKTYLERFLAENVRPDGRKLDVFRDISVNTGSITTANGSALVRLGDTTVVCGVKAELAEPELDAPDHGYLVPNLDLPALSSPKFKPGPPTDEAQILSQRLSESLAPIIDLTSLCVQEGKSVWVLYVDAVCINYDGNAFDASLIAMVAALKNVSLPKARYDEDSGRTICTRSDSTQLAVDASLPIPISFGIFDSTHLLHDPTSFEEPLLSSTVSIIVDSADPSKLISTSQLGGVANENLLDSCITAAQKRSVELSKYIFSS